MNLLLLCVSAYLAASLAATPEDFAAVLTTCKYPLRCYQLSLGLTVLGNNLIAYALTMRNVNQIEELYQDNAILVSSFMHSREGYSAGMTLFLFKDLASGSFPQMNYFLSRGTLIIFPFVNIDGYLSNGKFTDLLRKNMNFGNVPCKNEYEKGVDINRNFPFKFGVIAGSDKPCSEEYRGVGPFSEKESQAVKFIFDKFNVVINLDVHSWGNKWIYPFAYDATDKAIQLHQLYPLYSHLISSFTSKRIQISSCLQSLQYVADGVEIDWALSEGAFSLAYEIGQSFSQDSQAEAHFPQVLRQFYMVFEYAAVLFETDHMKDNTIVIRSVSMLPFKIVVTELPSRRVTDYLLAPLKEVYITYEDNDATLIIQAPDVETKQELTLTRNVQVEKGQISSSWFLGLLLFIVLTVCFMLLFRCIHTRIHSRIHTPAHMRLESRSDLESET